MRIKEENKQELLKTFVKMYIDESKSIKQISEITGYSREFVGNLINQNDEVKEYKNKRKFKLYKYKKAKKIGIFIPINFWEKIGIDKSSESLDYVDVQVDELNNQIIIKKHEN